MTLPPTSELPEIARNHNGTITVWPYEGPPTTFTSIEAYVEYLHYRLAQQEKEITNLQAEAFDWRMRAEAAESRAGEKKS